MGRASMGVATAVKRSAVKEIKSQYGIHLIWQDASDGVTGHAPASRGDVQATAGLGARAEVAGFQRGTWTSAG